MIPLPETIRLAPGHKVRCLIACCPSAAQEPLCYPQTPAIAAGYHRTEFAGHSLGVGFLMSATRAEASMFKIKEVFRHNSLDLLTGYMRDAQVFTDHANDDFT
jgi:hypothetical protein